MKHAWLLSLLLMAACSAPSASAPGPAELCAQTVRDYGPLRDNGPVEPYADLFTNEATFELGGAITRGREALIQRHINANKASKYSHNMIEVRIDDTASPISGRSRFIVYVGSRKQGEKAVVREIIGDYIDEFAVQGGRCKIASRKVSVIFDSLR